MWQPDSASIRARCLTIIGCEPTRWSAVSRSSMAPNGSSPCTHSTSGAVGPANALGGQTTKGANLVTYAALIAAPGGELAAKAEKAVSHAAATAVQRVSRPTKRTPSDPFALTGEAGAAIV